MIREFFGAVENWMDEGGDLYSLVKTLLVFGVGFTLLISPIIWLCVRHDQNVEKECLASGRAWMVTGSHWQSSFVMSGKIAVPINQQITDYGCVEVKAK